MFSFGWLTVRQTEIFKENISLFIPAALRGAGDVAASLSHLTAQTNRIVTDIGPDHLTLIKSESRWLIDGASHDHMTKNPILRSAAVTRPGQKQTTGPEAKWQQFSSIM